MKSVFVTVLFAVFTLSVMGKELPLASFLPRNTDFALRIQTGTLCSSPVFGEIRKRVPMAEQVLEEMVSSSCRIEDCRELLVFSTGSGEEGAFFRLKESGRTELVTRDGRKLLPELNSTPAIPVTDLPDNAVASAVWLPRKSRNGMRKFTSALYMTDGGSGLRLISRAGCKDSKSAKQLQSQVQMMYLVFGQGVFFSEDPRLGNELWQKIRLSRSGSGLNGELTVEPDLLLRILDHAGKAAVNIIKQLNADEAVIRLK